MKLDYDDNFYDSKYRRYVSKYNNLDNYYLGTDDIEFDDWISDNYLKLTSFPLIINNIDIVRSLQKNCRLNRVAELYGMHEISKLPNVEVYNDCLVGVPEFMYKYIYYDFDKMIRTEADSDNPYYKELFDYIGEPDTLFDTMIYAFMHSGYRYLDTMMHHDKICEIMADNNNSNVDINENLSSEPYEAFYIHKSSLKPVIGKYIINNYFNINKLIDKVYIKGIGIVNINKVPLKLFKGASRYTIARSAHDMELHVLYDRNNISKYVTKYIDKSMHE